MDGEEEIELEQYVGLVQKQTELFSTFDADTVFTALKEFAEVKSLTSDVATGKYKIKMMFIVGKFILAND